ncbi:subunit length determinant protein [Spirosoma oryzae]|uniref:Subunit length determinant protein n=1 Tax=Spirosoma oryzae TaxID=1469603 RepID=A0A2T0S1V5_9BACT|nr:lipopolysaccharide biosynthesis protein [Spirosoma oryzae]PRY27406.1 subunit length determinant protein [Spirosoma oryzae]
MSVTENYQPKQEDIIEIRVSDIAYFFRENRLRIIISGMIGLIIGAIYAFSKPNVYTAHVSVMPEIQSRGSGGMSGLGSLAGLAGINLDNISQDAIRPDIYPTILQGVPFGLQLMQQPVYSAQLNKQLPLESYINEMGKGRWSGFLGDKNKPHIEKNIKKPVEAQIVELTKEQNDLVKNILADVVTTYDKKTGILTISATEREATVAAAVAQRSLEYLTGYITSYRTEKSNRQVRFLEQQVAEAKKRYQTSEYTLSNYRDNNRSIYTNTAKIEEQRLQADYLLTQSVFNELSKQLEQAKIKVQEETPVFKTLEPPIVPLKKSGPKRTVTMLSFAICSVIIVLGVKLMKTFVQYNLSKQV